MCVRLFSQIDIDRWLRTVFFRTNDYAAGMRWSSWTWTRTMRTRTRIENADRRIAAGLFCSAGYVTCIEEKRREKGRVGISHEERTRVPVQLRNVIASYRPCFHYHFISMLAVAEKLIWFIVKLTALVSNQTFIQPRLVTRGHSSCFLFILTVRLSEYNNKVGLPVPKQRHSRRPIARRSYKIWPGNDFR